VLLRPPFSSTGRTETDVKTTLIATDELDAALLDRWKGWQVASGLPSNPFLSPSFMLAYGRHQARAKVAIIEDGGEVVGFLPVERTSLGSVRSMAWGLCDVQAPTFKPGFTPDARALLSSGGFALYEYDRMLPQFAEMLGGREVKRVASPVIDISSGYEDWLAAKRKASSSRFRRILQRQRQIAKEIGTIDFEFASMSHADLDELMSWKSSQYVRTGRRDRFARPWFRAVMHDLLDTTDSQFGVVLSKLRAGDHTLAYDLALKSGTTLAGWFPAYDLEFSNYSPGSVCMLMQIESASKEDFTRIDLGVGEAGYKESFKSFDDELVEGWIERRTPAAFLYKASKMPERVATDIVLSSPQLRTIARRALSTVGTVRHKVKSSS
jgi:CelD/BcsL family acetyltransferase involved in cellulose biosynthesis